MYYNSKAIFNIIIVVVIYAVTNALLFLYSDFEIKYQIGYYFNLGLCLIYFIANKESNGLLETNPPLDAPCHFTVFALSIWIMVATYFGTEAPLSKSTGVVLILGALAWFNMALELSVLIEERYKVASGNVIAIKVSLNIPTLLMAGWALYILLIGEWSWQVIP